MTRQAGNMLAIDDECIHKGIVYAISPTSVKLDPRLRPHILFVLTCRAVFLSTRRPTPKTDLAGNCRCQTREGCNIGMAAIRAPCRHSMLLHNGCSSHANHTWLKTACLPVDYLIQPCVAMMA